MKSIIQNYFFAAADKTNDCFLKHIGFYLLNQHVKSVNALYEFDSSSAKQVDNDAGDSSENISNKIICNEWPA